MSRLSLHKALTAWHCGDDPGIGERASMKIAIPKERRAQESRVAASPDTVKRLVGLGLEVVVESGAGADAAFTDAAYAAAAATIPPHAAARVRGAPILLPGHAPLRRHRRHTAPS